MSNIKYTKYNTSLAGTVKQNTVDGHIQKNEVLLETGWISDDFEFCEPKCYNLVTTETRDDDSRKNYTVPVGQFNQHTTFEESKCEKKPKSELIVYGASIPKKEPSKKSDKKPNQLYIVPGAPTLFYQQGNHSLCILSPLESEFHHMGDGYASEYIIIRKQKSLLEIHNKGQIHFCHDILLGHHKEKSVNRLNYPIEEWHTSTSYDIFWYQYNYLTICLLLDMYHHTDHCITVCSKWIFDSNIEVTFPLTQDFLNYICRGKETGDIKFVGVLHAIRAFIPEVVQIRLNMK